mmetsp:Transcript_30975/g.85384  ORF Transcript_30975/g.85384 Transcript_30975/m.85384 type:complete len:107 (-) Transcript_30975:45-365(-)
MSPHSFLCPELLGFLFKPYLVTAWLCKSPMELEDVQVRGRGHKNSNGMEARGCLGSAATNKRAPPPTRTQHHGQSKLLPRAQHAQQAHHHSANALPACRMTPHRGR